ncbi:NAD kinase [Candidatus Magnetomoraceae bacterium gMMP-15]
MKIGIIVKPDHKVSKNANDLESWLKARGVEIVRKKSLAPFKNLLQQKHHEKAPHDLACVFVLGGDGTFLNAVRWIGNQALPILGIKFGTVGFLAEISGENMFLAAEAVLNNDYILEQRMRFCVTLIRDKKEITHQTILNDVVINKGALARLATIKTYADDHYLTTYKADGLIICTPTGSTAYSLAAGGPIVHPAVAGMLITPICPFTLTNRPLIIPDSVKIKITLAEDSTDIMLTFDGQAGLKLTDRDTILIEKSLHPVNIITMPDQNYFDVLKTKLRWSGGRM